MNPVVVIGPPRYGHVVVAEIAWYMEYLSEENPAEKELASSFFPENTMLSCKPTY